MRSYRVLPGARAELIEAADYYEAHRPGYGAKFRTEYEKQLLRARHHFGSGGAVDKDCWPPEIRRFLLHTFRESIIVADAGSMLLVVAVAGHKQRPGYWHERLEP